MYFTKGRRRQYERLMKEKPGFDAQQTSGGESEEPRKRGRTRRRSIRNEAGERKTKSRRD